MNAVVGVLDGSCTACDGAAAGTCSAATCESNFHTFVDGVGCTSCAAAMNAVVGVLDGSCTACDGNGAASTCSAATCSPGYHTFADGVGCTVNTCTAKTNAGDWTTLGCTTTTPTATTVSALGEVTPASGYESCVITCPTNNAAFAVISVSSAVACSATGGSDSCAAAANMAVSNFGDLIIVCFSSRFMFYRMF